MTLLQGAHITTKAQGWLEFVLVGVYVGKYLYGLLCVRLLLLLYPLPSTFIMMGNRLINSSTTCFLMCGFYFEKLQIIRPQGQNKYLYMAGSPCHERNLF